MIPFQMLASSRCRQLARALQSFATRVSYEDVRLAATHLSQCATNVLSVRSLLCFLRVHLTALSLSSRRSMGLCNKEAIPSAWMTRGRMPFPPTMTLIWSPSGPILVSSSTDTRYLRISILAFTGLFADGTDFSWQAIQKGRNAHYQRQAVSELDILHHHRTPLLCRNRPKLSPVKWPTRLPSSAQH